MYFGFHTGEAWQMHRQSKRKGATHGALPPLVKPVHEITAGLLLHNAGIILEPMAHLSASQARVIFPADTLGNLSPFSMMVGHFLYV